jgi:ABC-type antimicrobial peptide transport system permease subunit
MPADQEKPRIGNHDPEFSLNPMEHLRWNAARPSLHSMHSLLYLFIEICNNLKYHRVRTLLTGIGVVIGITAVFTIFSLSDAGTAHLRQYLQQFKPETLSLALQENNSMQPAASIMQPHGSTQSEKRFTPRMSFFSDEMIKALSEAFLSRAHVVPYGNVRTESVSINERKINLNEVIATSHDLPQIRDLTFSGGWFFSRLDTLNPVIVLSVLPDGKIPGYDGPVLGERICLNNCYFSVIGTVVKDPENAFMPDAYIPYSLFTQSIRINKLYVMPRHKSDNIADQIAGFFETLYKTNPVIMSAEEESKNSLEALRFFTKIMGIVAAISLLVGCIGVANTLCAFVTEKTFELGVRSALGVSPRFIFFLFLGESILLCLFSSILGIGAGNALTILFCRMNNIQWVVSTMPFIISLASAVGVGLISGLVPALGAARLHPWVALKKGSE